MLKTLKAYKTIIMINDFRQFLRQFKWNNFDNISDDHETEYLELSFFRIISKPNYLFSQFKLPQYDF